MTIHLISLLAVMNTTMRRDRNLHIGLIIFILLDTEALTQWPKAILLNVENYQANFQGLY